MYRKKKKGNEMKCRRSRKKAGWAAYGITAGAGIVCALAVTLFFSDGAGRGSAESFSQNIVYEGRNSGSTEYGSVGVASELTQGYQSDWQLILVNRWNPIPEDYDVTLTELQNGQAVDSRIYPELQAMFDDARAEGMLPMITSSYRTAEYQQSLLDEKIAEYQTQGYSDTEAKELAEKWVAVPGTSEHQIGIAVDISTADSTRQDASVVWQWLRDNSYKYGFILRYTEEKTNITGVIDEPWHYRYVGKEAAKEIYEQGVCLEEYLEGR